MLKTFRDFGAPKETINLDRIKRLRRVLHWLINSVDSGVCSTFPMSGLVQKVYTNTRESHPDWFINTYALRLAAQETR